MVPQRRKLFGVGAPRTALYWLFSQGEADYGADADYTLAAATANIFASRI